MLQKFQICDILLHVVLFVCLFVLLVYLFVFSCFILDYTYYSDLRDNGLYRVNKWTGGAKRYQFSGEMPIYNLQYYSRDAQTGMD